MNVATGGFGTELTVKTDEGMKNQLGGMAYLITGNVYWRLCQFCTDMLATSWPGTSFSARRFCWTQACNIYNWACLCSQNMPAADKLA